MQARGTFVTTVSICLMAAFSQRAAAQPSAEVCNSSGGPEICVRFENLATAPQLGFDFDLSFDGSGIPSIQFLTGTDTQTERQWRVWCKDAQENPADINAITAVGAFDYDVRILQPDGDPGADDVGIIDLDPSAAGNFSKITSGELSGDLVTELFLQVSSGGSGGQLTLEVAGDVSGDVTAPKVLSLVIGRDVLADLNVEEVPDSGLLSVGGDVGSDAKVTIETVEGELRVTGDVVGDVSIEDIVGDNAQTACVNGDGCARIDGTLSGELAVTGVIDTADLLVNGPVASTGVITINNLTGEGAMANLNAEHTGTFAGDLALTSGVPANTKVVISGDVTSATTIDLTGDNVAGELRCGDGNAGNIINGGAVTNLVQLAHDLGEVFSGTATFTSVSGEVRTANSNGLTGTITVTGSVSGAITLDAMSSTALVSIGGDVSGGGVPSVGVGRDMAGDVCISGDLLSSGTISIGDKLKSTGRILIDGLCSGTVSVGENTEALSLIRATEGLGSSGSITVNFDEGDFDADGSMYFGTTTASPPLDSVTFDGSILILDDSSGNGGDLGGRIRVVGCHATADDLDICLCGGDGAGNIEIVQTNCTNQVEASCVSGCP